MNIVLDIDNTLFKTQEFLKEHGLLNAPTRPIPYWGFEAIEDNQVKRDIEIYRSIPLVLVPLNWKVVRFVNHFSIYRPQIYILTGRYLTSNELRLIEDVLDWRPVPIKIIDGQSFTDKMAFLDSLKNFVVVDDWSGLESFIRDLHPTHNCYYVVPDLEQMHEYSRSIMIDLFKHKHMWFNVFVHPEHFENSEEVKQQCKDLMKLKI